VTVGARVLGRRSVRRGVRAGLLAMALGLPGMAQGKRPPRRCTTAWEDVGPPPMGPAEGLDDPALAGVAEPQGRLRVEALQQSINDIRSLAAAQLGPTLGISAGFNSLDGD